MPAKKAENHEGLDLHRGDIDAHGRGALVILAQGPQSVAIIGVAEAIDDENGDGGDAGHNIIDANLALDVEAEQIDAREEQHTVWSPS